METIPVIKYVNQCTMHICEMNFSLLASYWQIKALLMLAPSAHHKINTSLLMLKEFRTLPRVGMHWKIHPLGPRDFPRAGILHPSALESLGPRGA